MVLVFDPVPTVTITSTAPAVWAGVVAVQVVLVLQVTLVAATPPNLKLVPPLVSKLAPVIVILVPPDAGPEIGERVEMVGANTRYVNPPVRVADCPPIETVTSTAPAAWGGVVTEQTMS